MIESLLPASQRPGPFNDRLGRILLAGRLCDSCGVPFDRMRVLGSYAVVFLTDGEGSYQCRGREPVRCRRGDLLIVFPEIPHAYGPDPGGGWDEYYLVFDGALFDLWRSHGLLSPERSVVRFEQPGVAEREIRGLVRAAVVPGRTGGDQLALVSRLQLFLSKAVAGPAEIACPEWAARAMQALEDPRADLQLAARAAGQSYESFRKKFRALTGLSPVAWRDRQAMQCARKWIYEEGLTNKEIAERLGYCDEFHFSKRFREITGLTPRAARMSFRGGSQQSRTPPQPRTNEIPRTTSAPFRTSGG